METSFTTIDWVVLVALGLGMWRGFQGGFIKEIAQIFGLLVAFMMGLQLMHVVGDIVAGILGVDGALAPAVGFVAVFLILLLVVQLLTKFLMYLLSSLKLGILDKMGGGVLGALKSALVLSILLIPLSEINIPSEEARAQSTLYPAVEAVAPFSWGFAKKFWPSAQNISDKIGGRLKKQIDGKEDNEVSEPTNTAPEQEDQ